MTQYWPTFRLKEICDISSSRRIRAHEYTESGVPFYRGKEIIEKHNGALRVSTDLFISEERFSEVCAKNGAPSAGDLLLTSVGTLGIPYVVQPGERFYFKDGNLTWFRNFEGLTSDYLYYWLLSPSGKAELKRCTIGSSQPAFTIVLLKDIEIALPPLPVQRRIASILSAYDDLIENNTRRIEILEEMARRLYEEWFVHFRFPGHEEVRFKESELGEVPEGWEVVQFKDVANNFDRMRKPLSKKQRAERQGVYPYYGAAKVFDYIDDYIFDGRYLLLAEDGSVIDKDGFPVLQMANGKFWANNHTHILQGKSPASTEFLYLALSGHPISGYITGAAQPKITQANMNRIPLVMANLEIHEAFDQLVRPMFDIQETLEKKNANLRAQRDLLLPKLVSGEIDVSDIPMPDDKEVEAA